MYSIHSCIFFQVNKKETIYYKGFDALRQSFLKTYLGTHVVRYLEVVRKSWFLPSALPLRVKWPYWGQKLPKYLLPYLKMGWHHIPSRVLVKIKLENVYK